MATTQVKARQRSALRKPCSVTARATPGSVSSDFAAGDLKSHSNTNWEAPSADAAAAVLGRAGIGSVHTTAHDGEEGATCSSNENTGRVHTRTTDAAAAAAASAAGEPHMLP